MELTTRDVSVRVCAADNAGSYAFRCPHCRLAVAKDAPARIVDLLVSSGVPMTMWELPAELAERPEGPTICHDDLLDFHALLESEGWFEVLASITSQ